MVKNSHTPETVDISGSKDWQDKDNQDGVRQDSITIELLANGTKVKEVTVTEEDGWSWKFEDLPKYANGNQITYTIREHVIEDYSTKITGNAEDGFVVTNTHTPDQTSVTVTKSWKDEKDQDGIRPDEVTVHLLADGKDTGKSATLSESNGWTYTFSELDMKKDGINISYTVSEDKVEGYVTTISGTATVGYTVTNTHTPATTSAEGSKTWTDNENQDGVRPDSITVILKADGVEKERKTVTEADDWKWSFTDLPKYRDGGVEILYTIAEVKVDDYVSEVTDYNIENIHAPGKTSVSVIKVWNDADDQDKVRPDEVTVHLLADGEDTGKSLTLSADNKWQGTFTDLDEKCDGQTIIYTLVEDAVSDYTSEITGTAETGYTITNTHVPETPDTPDNPDTPATPDNPDKPNNPDAPNTSETPGTGDTNSLGLWAMWMTVSAAFSVCIFKRKRRGEK